MDINQDTNTKVEYTTEEEARRNVPIDFAHLTEILGYTKELNSFDRNGVSRKALKEFRKSLLKSYIDTHISAVEFIDFIEMNTQDLINNPDFTDIQKAEAFDLAKKAVNGEVVSEHRVKELSGIYNISYVIATNLQEAQRKVAEKALYLKRVELLDTILKNYNLFF